MTIRDGIFSFSFSSVIKVVKTSWAKKKTFLLCLFFAFNHMDSLRTRNVIYFMKAGLSRILYTFMLRYLISKKKFKNWLSTHQSNINSKEGFYDLSIHQIFIEHLPYARHCSGHWEFICELNRQEFLLHRT